MKRRDEQMVQAILGIHQDRNGSERAADAKTQQLFEVVFANRMAMSVVVTMSMVVTVSMVVSLAMLVFVFVNVVHEKSPE